MAGMSPVFEGYQQTAMVGEEMEPVTTSSARPEIPDDVTPAGYFNTLVLDRINRCAIPKIKSINVLVEFCISGESGGRWGLVINNGMAKEIICAEDSDQDPYARSPDCTFIMSEATFLSILHHEITPQKAFFARRVDVKGNILLALKANNLVSYL